MISFILDIFNFIIFFTKKYEIGFFVENKNIFEYLKPYLLKKSKKKKIAVITFEKLDKINFNVDIYYFKSNLIRELVFSTLKLKFLYSSTPNLNNNIFKKSKFSSCKYIYLQHSLCSVSMIYNSNAFDNFDAVQSVTNYQFEEYQKIKKLKKLKYKIFKSNYLFLKEKFKKKKTHNFCKILVAPTWKTNFYKLKIHKKLNDLFINNNIEFDFRPHPMSLKKEEISIKELQSLNIKLNVDTNLNYLDYEILITDWSGIFLEFALINKKVLLIETEKKVLNYEYENLNIKPAEIKFRDVLAKNFDLRDLNLIIPEIKNELKKNNNSFINIDKFYFDI